MELCGLEPPTSSVRSTGRRLTPLHAPSRNVRICGTFPKPRVTREICDSPRFHGPLDQKWTIGHEKRVYRGNRKAAWAAAFLHGARRTRTADLLGAIQALSQLSYSPGRR
jgi:hypothetical protein